jgi:hypothetical protein
MLQDFRFALRTLAKSPGFTAVAVLTLALGIGLNATQFTAASPFLFRPLPFKDSERLVHLDTAKSGPTAPSGCRRRPQCINWPWTVAVTGSVVVTLRVLDHKTFVELRGPGHLQYRRSVVSAYPPLWSKVAAKLPPLVFALNSVPEMVNVPATAAVTSLQFSIFPSALQVIVWPPLKPAWTVFLLGSPSAQLMLSLLASQAVKPTASRQPVNAMATPDHTRRPGRATPGRFIGQPPPATG